MTNDLQFFLWHYCTNWEREQERERKNYQKSLFLAISYGKQESLAHVALTPRRSLLVWSLVIFRSPGCELQRLAMLAKRKNRSR